MDKAKYKQRLLELEKNPNHIPGIYNYCDRWCERCAYTSRCLVYAQEKEMNGGEDANDISNEKFWEQLKLSFEVTFELIAETAEELGIDLNDIPDADLPEHIPGIAEERSKEYSLAILNWLKQKNEQFAEKARELQAIEEEKLVKFADAVEVVQWYSVFISAKVHRAHFRIDEKKGKTPDISHDNIGSAKVALLSIDRSIEALTVLYHYLKDDEDEILRFLVDLSFVKKQMLATFPNAMAFIRPGFDEKR